MTAKGKQDNVYVRFKGDVQHGGDEQGDGNAGSFFVTCDPAAPMKTLQSLLEDSAALRVLAGEYTYHGIDRPERLTERLKKLAREIKEAHRREQEEQLARLEAEVRELRSKEEKRVAAEKEIARLKQALGV